MNGRINLIDIQKDPLYSLHEDIPSRNDKGYRDALVGNQQDTILSKAYFSAENITIIHNAIRAGVYQKSEQKYVVGHQDMNGIQIIMRGVFLEYARYLPNKITQEIEYLNSIVIDHCVHQIFNDLISHMKYRRDVSTLAIPHENPINDNSKGYNSLENKNWF